MRFRHRQDHPDRYTDEDGAYVDDRDRRLERVDTVDEPGRRWGVGSVLAVAAGVALIVIGAVALIRTEVDSTWYQPVEQVFGMDHTPLLGAIEVGVGVLLVLAGLAGANLVAALIALVAGTAATVVAIEPDLVDRELAIEREWATTLAVASFVLAMVIILAQERRHGRRVERRVARTT